MSPRAPPQNHHSQPTMHLTNSGFPVSSGSSSAPNTGLGFQTEHSDPQPISQGGYDPTSVQSSASGFRNTETNLMQHQNRDSNSINDSSMDMHSDSPSHEPTY